MSPYVNEFKYKILTSKIQRTHGKTSTGVNFLRNHQNKQTNAPQWYFNQYVQKFPRKNNNKIIASTSAHLWYHYWMFTSSISCFGLRKTFLQMSRNWSYKQTFHFDNFFKKYTCNQFHLIQQVSIYISTRYLFVKLSYCLCQF